MRYLLMIYASQATWAGPSPEEWTKGIAEQDAFNREFFETGELLGAVRPVMHEAGAEM
ncbi:MAG: hypothetical protein ACRDPO_00410 [Streptosporangiaceae bacterium]